MSKKSGVTEIDQMLIQIIKEKKPKNVEQLVLFAEETLNTTRQEIISAILRLQSDGKISLAEPIQQAAPKITLYLKTKNALWYWLTMATAMATAITVFTIPEDLFPLVYIRYVLGLIFVLWLPGYTLVKALFPAEPQIKGSRKDLDVIERVALSMGLSLALVPMVGLLLNYTPWGIRLTPIVLSLLAMVLIFATAALIREHQTQNKLIKQT